MPLPRAALGTIYTVTGLGMLPADATSTAPVSSIATAVSTNGNAVGYTTFADGSTEATYWPASGGIIGLGGTDSKAYGINDTAGFIVGQTSGQAVVWTPGENLLTPGFGGQANGVNDSGVIIGNLIDGPSHTVTVWFPDNTSSLINTTLNETGTAINNLGQIVGYSVDYPDIGYWVSSTDPHSGFGIGGLDPTALNDSGLAGVTGATIENGQWVAYTWGHLIGTLGHDLTSFALGINNANTVVGVSGNGGMLDPNGSATVIGITDSQGFVYDSTHGLQGIDSLLDPASSSWTVWSANAINSNGQIVGWGEYNLGQQQAVLLTPVPEPGTRVLAGLGAIGLVTHARRRRRRSGRAHVPDSSVPLVLGHSRLHPDLETRSRS